MNIRTFASSYSGASRHEVVKSSLPPVHVVGICDDRADPSASDTRRWAPATDRGNVGELSAEVVEARADPLEAPRVGLEAAEREGRLAAARGVGDVG